MDILSKRLRVIADMIHDNTAVMADVGCDHGYLSIALLQEKRVRSAIAMDLRPGPLAHAKENIARFGLQGQIETRLSDGMKKLLPGEVNLVVIAGMGGPLMVRLLSQSPEIVAGLSEIILEPQSEPETLRSYLAGHSFGEEKKYFRIAEEAFVQEEGKYYPVIRYVACEKAQSLTEAENFFGPELLRSRPALLLTYLQRRKQQDEVLAEKLRKTIADGSEKARSRLAEVEKDLFMISQILQERKA